MKYKDLFEITKYCKNNGIELDKELVDILVDINSFNENLLPILKLESELAKKLLERYADFEGELSPFFNRVDISFEEKLYCLNLIANQEWFHHMQEVVFACLNDVTRENKEVLELIASMDSWEQVHQLRLICLNDAIRNDIEALKLIAKQDTVGKMQEMCLACENDAIREDKVALELIASQKKRGCMQQLRQACGNSVIRQDKVALKLIASQETVDTMIEVIEACEVDAIREDKVALNLIASQWWLNCMQEMRYACEHDVIRENRDLLHLIANKATANDMRRIWIPYVEKHSIVIQKRPDIESQDKFIAEKRARLEQEAQLLEMLRNGNVNEFQDLFQENPDLNAETTIKR